MCFLWNHHNFTWVVFNAKRDPSVPCFHCEMKSYRTSVLGFTCNFNFLHKALLLITMCASFRVSPPHRTPPGILDCSRWIRDTDLQFCCRSASASWRLSAEGIPTKPQCRDSAASRYIRPAFCRNEDSSRISGLILLTAHSENREVG